MKTKAITVALADDHTLFRKGISEIISSVPDFQIIIETENGQLLLQKLQDAACLPDVCLLDISMPVMNGYDTLIHLRKNWPDLKVLVLTMHDHEFSIIKMLKSGAKGYISKSENPDKLIQAIRSVHEHGYYHSDLIAKNVSEVLSTHGHANTELTKKEIEFLGYCCTDYTYQQIADLMNLSPRTIEGYRDSLFSKLQVKSRSGLVMFTIQTGIIPIAKLQ